MSDRRMFSKRIANTSRFLQMPLSSQALYFHLGLNADDEGIVEAFPVLRMTNCNEDDLKVLVTKEYIKILNEELISLICDWKENNYIRPDRKKKSIYENLLIQIQMTDKCQSNDGQLTTECPRKLGKDKLSKDKGSTTASILEKYIPNVNQAWFDVIEQFQNLSQELIEYAIKETAASGSQSARYFRAVCERLVSEGITQLSQIKGKKGQKNANKSQFKTYSKEKIDYDAELDKKAKQGGDIFR